MLDNISPISTERERAELRELIEQKTKEHEARNGKIAVHKIERRDVNMSDWDQAANSRRKSSEIDAAPCPSESKQPELSSSQVATLKPVNPLNPAREAESPSPCLRRQIKEIKSAADQLERKIKGFESLVESLERGSHVAGNR